jgi:hypothetical protein
VCGLLALFAVRSPIACCCFHAHKEAAVLCAAGVGCFVFCLFGIVLWSILDCFLLLI